tara:strand:- start:216 stop:419 length:204 start_codon:yes stop_codon:yes gene_type:complete
MNHIKKGAKKQGHSKFVPNDDDVSMSDELEPVLYKEDNNTKENSKFSKNEEIEDEASSDDEQITKAN